MKSHYFVRKKREKSGIKLSHYYKAQP